MNRVSTTFITILGELFFWLGYTFNDETFQSRDMVYWWWSEPLEKIMTKEFDFWTLQERFKSIGNVRAGEYSAATNIALWKDR